MTLTEKIWNRTATEVKPELEKLVSAWLPHQLYWISVDEKFVTPGAARMQLELMNRAGTDGQSADDLVARADEMAALKRIADNPGVQDAARREVNRLFLNQRQAVDALAEAVEASLAEQAAELVAAEKAFFATYGVAPEPTAVSKTVVQIRASFALNIATLHNGCKTIESSPGGSHMPSLELETFAPLLEQSK